MSYKLGINNTGALRSILSIACGDKHQIIRLKEKKNEYFHIKNAELLEAIMFLIDEGKKMRDEHTRFDIKDSTFAVQTLYEALMKVFGITTKSPKRAKNEEEKSDISGQIVELESDNSLSYAGVRDFDINDLLDNDDLLAVNIELLINSAWNDGKYLYLLTERITKFDSGEPGRLHAIWGKFPEKGKEILIKKLRGVYDDAVELMERMDSIMAHKIKENIKYVRALEDGTNIEITSKDKEEQSVIDQLNDQDAKTAYRIGCTFNITGFREFNQKFYMCETCEAITGEDVIVCLSCVEFCHAGHKLMKGKKGKRSRIVCSCGSNTFPDCPVNDKKNPLIPILGQDKLPQTKCCLLKTYKDNILQRGKQLRQKFYQNQKANFEKRMKGEPGSGEDAPFFGSGFLKKIIPDNINTSGASTNLRNPLTSIREEAKLGRSPSNNTIEEMEKEVNDLSAEEEGGSSINNSDFEGGDDEEDSDFEKLMNEDIQIRATTENAQDEDDEAEEFDELLSQYNSEMFIRDLIKVLNFDTAEIAEKCPKLVSKNFRLFDESLQRKVHLYEHIILLAHGFCRSGLLKILTNKGILDTNSLHRSSKPFEPGHNNFYDACITFVSAYQGDLDNFSKYCRGLLHALELEGGTDFPAREKAIKTLMLIRGDSILNEIEGISATNDQYESIFKKLFGKQSKKAMYLHKLATMSEDDLNLLFEAKETQSNATKVMNFKKLAELLIDDFLVRHLEMDSDSINWLSCLTRISSGDYDGIDYLAKEYDISNAKASIYRAICTRDYMNMDPLFRAIDSEVPFELCKQISWVLNGDIDEFRDLLLNRIQIETHKTNFRLNYDNVYKVDFPPELENERADLGDYLKILFSLIEGESFDLGDLRKIIRLCGIDEDIAHVFLGYNAILNKDFVNVSQMFEFEKFKNSINNSELMDAVLGLASNRWNSESLKLIMENIIVSNNLYPQYNVSDVIEKISNQIEFETVINLIEAVEGDMQSLGQI